MADDRSHDRASGSDFMICGIRITLIGSPEYADMSETHSTVDKE